MSNLEENHDDANDPTTDPLTGHCYDGIEEYDNPLPGWWKWLFVATIVFSLGYIPIYHGTQARRITDYYEAAVAENLRLQFAELGDLTADNDVILKYSNDQKWVTVGKSVFSTNCVSCHGAQAQGLVGPNLTDDFWKQVQQPEDIAKIVREGAAGGAMPSWKNRLHPNEVVLVASYLVSLRGTNPPDAKQAEGKPVEPWVLTTIGDKSGTGAPQEPLDASNASATTGSE